MNIPDDVREVLRLALERAKDDYYATSERVEHFERVRWFSNWHRAARWLNEQRMRDRIDAAGIHDGDDWDPQF